MGKRIGIIGAGISGLLACKYAVSKGFIPIVFESRDTIGGVWTNTVETTKLQSPKPFYQFSDFPWDSSVETLYPDQQQMLNYLNSYAKHFDLIKHIKFNTKVLGIKYEGFSEDEIQSWSLWGGNGEPFSNKGTWSVTVQDLNTHSTEVVQVDFVILCLGRYSDVPNMPEFPEGKGPEEFHGEVMHSMDYANLDNESAKKLIKGKRVTVVGFQKSGLDIAMECSSANGVEHPCTMICRTPHWNLPMGYPHIYMFLTRFGELMLKKPGQGLFLDFVTAMLSPLRWGYCKFIESDMKKKYPLEKFGMLPDHSFYNGLNSCSILLYPDGFYDDVEKGSLVLKRSSTFTFCKEGVVLDDSQKGKEVVKSELVIFATGFKGEQKIKDVFESNMFKDFMMGSPHHIIPLYRQCINPRIPQLAAIAYSESPANLYTFEMKCRWLMELLDGKFKLPTINEMEKDISEWDKFMKRYSGNKYFRKSCIAGVHIWYSDQLCKDMGWNPKRKKGFRAEMFEVFGPMDYISN